MVAKTQKIRSDDFFYWDTRKSTYNAAEFEYDHDEKRSLALSVNLLLKNKKLSQPNLIRLPAHLISSPSCTCSRSFHLFCTDLFPSDEQNIDMLYIHPAPRIYERDYSRRIPTPFRKSRQKFTEDNDLDTIITSRSEPPPSLLTSTETQFNEKKAPTTTILPPRTISVNIPSAYHSFQQAAKSSIKITPSVRLSRQINMNPSQFYLRSMSVFDQSPSASQVFIPRGPPPSPKTPTLESSIIGLRSPRISSPLRTIPLTLRPKQPNENEKKTTTQSSTKTINYEDHAKEYLSVSDCSDDDDDDKNNNNNNDPEPLLTITKPKLPPARTQSLSRTDMSLRDRLLTHATSRYMSLAEVYYSPLDVYKNLSTKARKPQRSQTRLMATTTTTTTTSNENDDASTTITKATAKTMPVPTQSKSVFGFSKTASSMHFGHAAGRLPLQTSFEKWPKPVARRTPIERKQEVTALRLVTLPLVTS